jgi:hypothetical protein
MVKPSKTRSKRFSTPEGMRLIEGGEFLMGSDDFYPEEIHDSGKTAVSCRSGAAP